jgi:cytochrome c-type biogenesis protein CcmH/NrfF
MTKRTFLPLIVVLLFLFTASLLASCSTTKTASASSTADLSQGQQLMQERCSACHSTARITSAHKTAAEWTTTVERMVSNGAQLTTAEQQTLVDFLAANYK